MASMNHKTTAIVLMLSFLFIISMSEARLFHVVFGNAKPSPAAPTCETVVGVLSGDTCFGIIKSNNLRDEEFAAINPNLNCDALFVGQWVCVVGSAL